MAQEKEFIARLEERVSKSGSPYTCIVIELAPNYEKLVFLSTAEKALVEKDG